MNTYSLVGYTGFVGSNIAENGQFQGLYNTRNIETAFGTSPEVLIYAGLRAEKYIANKFPDEDMQKIYEAIDNIKRINPEKLVLISTIDVYDHPDRVNEDDRPDENRLLPYGKNRLFLEKWVENNFKKYCIIRLPGLFGNQIKKNFIYDLITGIPFKLTEKKIEELSKTNENIKAYYELGDDGFYKCRTLSEKKKKRLMNILEEVNFTAINFTDSRGIFQFYNLKYLWSHIQKCLELDIRKINMATEPVQIGELYTFITGKDFVNFIMENPPYYDFCTKYAADLGGSNGYIFKKDQVMKDIRDFVKSRSF